ncbi:mobile mystery protein B [Cyanobium sp. WAJ14-Wanaka]|uniref:mobile mystery protein B n=1 Tax=Cyanobium sp. WAJ14-Wanaka TaxID=2823725 RepID=UPI0020CC2F47|nr:mobile mystery protein B [Cyanobium sp. WAJ14-Wanaka]MCP9774830.1 mobile mystery protein B [Cyanobium sp. WAJ14-Wanaka]
MNDDLPAGATPLDGEELEGLLPTHLVNRSQLNEWEQQNIEACLLWLSRLRRPRPLEENWLRRLHREMFGQSWRWAGQYLNSDKNIGADWRQIRMQVPALLADIAIRFHHRLVSIHPFPNGNGRHPRLIADVLIEQLGAPRFSWGGSNYLVDASAQRQKYIAALQQADRGNISALLAFARAS